MKIMVWKNLGKSWDIHGYIDQPSPVNAKGVVQATVKDKGYTSSITRIYFGTLASFARQTIVNRTKSGR
jgi:hypothetical protein